MFVVVYQNCVDLIMSLSFATYRVIRKIRETVSLVKGIIIVKN